MQFFNDRDINLLEYEYNMMQEQDDQILDIVDDDEKVVNNVYMLV